MAHRGGWLSSTEWKEGQTKGNGHGECLAARSNVQRERERESKAKEVDKKWTRGGQEVKDRR